MSSKVFYIANLLNQRDYTRQKIFIGIPVIRYKVMVTENKKPEINHFERAILSLCSHKNYLSEDIAELLALDIQLIKFILESLANRNLHHKDIGTTETGKNILSSIYQEKTMSKYHIFYDKNQQKLLSYFFEIEKVKATELKRGKFAIHSDASYIPDESLYLIPSLAKMGSYNEVSKKIRVDPLLNKKSIMLSELINEPPQEGFLVCALTTLPYGANQWYASSPINITNRDERITEFLSRNIQNEQIANIILPFLKKNAKKVAATEGTFTHEVQTMMNSLFEPSIAEEHRTLIHPLSKLLIAKSTTHGAVANLEDQELRKNKAIALFELLEKLIYFGCKKDNFANEYSGELTSSPILNAEHLIGLASQLGFNTTDHAKSLLTLDSKAIYNCRMSTSTPLIGPIVAYALLMSYKRNDHFLKAIALKYPDFLNDIYMLKKLVRDKERHSLTLLDSRNGSGDLNLVLFLFNCILGYTINKSILKELTAQEIIRDYSYAETVLRSKLDNRFFESSNPRITLIKQNLIIAHELMEKKDPGYLINTRAIIEDILKHLITIGRQYLTNSPGSNDWVFDEFSSADDFLDCLDDFGFSMKPLLERQVQLEIPFRYSDDSRPKIQEILTTSNTNFNMSIGIKILVILFFISKQFRDSFKLEDHPILKDLFMIFIAIMFVDKGHHQNREFHADEALILLNHSSGVIDALYRLNILDN